MNKSYLIIYRDGKKKKFQAGEGITYEAWETGNFLVIQKYNYYENKGEGNLYIPISRIKEVREIKE